MYIQKQMFMLRVFGMQAKLHIVVTSKGLNMYTLNDKSLCQHWNPCSLSTQKCTQKYNVLFDWVEILIIKDLDTVYLQYISSIIDLHLWKLGSKNRIFMIMYPFGILILSDTTCQYKKKNLIDKASMNLNNKKKMNFKSTQNEFIDLVH